MRGRGPEFYASIRTGSLASPFGTISLFVGVMRSVIDTVQSSPANVVICIGLAVMYRRFITAELHSSVLALRKVFRNKGVSFFCWLQELCKIIIYILLHQVPFIYFMFLLSSRRPWEPLA